jgi:hypothetical protein
MNSGRSYEAQFRTQIRGEEKPRGSVSSVVGWWFTLGASRVHMTGWWLMGSVPAC